MIFFSRSTLAELEWSDAVRIAEGKDTLSADECDNRIRTGAGFHDGRHRFKNMGGSNALGMRFFESDGEDVEENFGIGCGIEVTVVRIHQFFP